MFKTGNILADFLSQLVVFFPLLPAFIILLRKIYRKDELNFLMIVCLLNFCGGLMMQLPEGKYVRLSAIHNIFALLQLLILVQLFKTAMPGKLREMVTVITIALLSSCITYYFVQGIDHQKKLLDILQYALIIFLAAYCLLTSVQKDNLRILHSPVFWIATGSFFYFSIAALLDIVEQCCLPRQHGITDDKTLLLHIASIARYFFYTLAGLLYNRSTV